MSRSAAALREAFPWSGRVIGWLRGARAGLLVMALVIGAGAGLGAIVFRYLISAFTWLATGHLGRPDRADRLRAGFQRRPVDPDA